MIAINWVFARMYALAALQPREPHDLRIAAILGTSLFLWINLMTMSMYILAWLSNDLYIILFTYFASFISVLVFVYIKFINSQTKHKNRHAFQAFVYVFISLLSFWGVGLAINKAIRVKAVNPIYSEGNPARYTVPGPE